MGCDGGTIPKRDELVKVKKKPETKDKQAELSFQWRCCVISQESLQSPIVICRLGKLYNKSAVIEALLNRSLLPLTSKHIRSLKDIKDINLTLNPEYKENAENSHETSDSRAAPFICPVTGLEMSGKFRFICLWSCGCVMSERAIKEVNTSLCHKCQTPFTNTDVIILNAIDEDLNLMKKNMETFQALQKARKKAKKTETITHSDTSNLKETTIIQSNNKLPSSGPSTSNQNSTKIKRPSESLNSTLADPDIKKIKTDYSVAKDPKVTDVYKSLFTSHQSEKDQTRAHWVTYNPFYN